MDQLDFVILSALEIDTDFNVSPAPTVILRGAIGGHPDYDATPIPYTRSNLFVV